MEECEVTVTQSMVDNVASMKYTLEEILKEYKELVLETLYKETTNKEAFKVNSMDDIEDAIKEIQECYYVIPKNELSTVLDEVKKLKDLLPKIINKEQMHVMMYKVHRQGKELKSVRIKLEKLEQENRSLKSTHEVLRTELGREKQNNLNLKQEAKDLVDISKEQSFYCAKLGTMTFNLLWRTSDNDDNVLKMLNGEQGDKFLELSGFTLDNYLSAIQDQSDVKHIEMEGEHRFVFMLVGFITNISASAFGREFITTKKNGKITLDALIAINEVIPLNKNRWQRLRNLILKILYNISINEKGYSYLCTQKFLFKRLALILEEEKTTDNRFQTARILHSMILEPKTNTDLLHDIDDVLPVHKLQKLISSTRGELQSELQDLLADFQLLRNEL